MKHFIYILIVTFSTPLASFANVESNFFPVELNFNKKKERERRKKVLRFAKEFTGAKYKYGGASPAGFDCSGYTHYVFKKMGINLNRSSTQQSKQGKKKKIKDLKPADLVFFGNKRSIQHVGIVLEASKEELYVIHCSSSGGIMIQEVYGSPYWSKRLLFGKEVINL